jgi:diguanylate cyclase (GGDEF)-like protein
MSRRTMGQRLTDLVLGTEPKMRTPVAMGLVTAGMYMACSAIIWFVGIPHGLLTPSFGHLLIGLQLFAALVSFPLLRSSLTRHWRDPGLTATQMLWASATLILAYPALEAVRPSSLQTLCLIQVFGFLGLQPRAARWVGAATIAMLLFMLAVASVLQLPNFDMREELLKVGGSCFIIGFLSLQSSTFALLRKRISGNKHALKNTLADVLRITRQDALTGLPNRPCIQERMQAECERSDHTGSCFSVAIVALDHFKQINDAHGHQVGDDVLIGFGQVAQEVLRETDIIGRWGGDEFVVLRLDTDPTPLAVNGLQRIRTALAERALSAQAPDVRVRFSAGITSSSQSETLEQLMARAYKALYQAKSEGRHRTCICPPQPHTSQAIAYA